MSKYHWLLDNGHGSKTPGKRSPYMAEYDLQLLEFEFNRDIVRRISVGLDKLLIKNTIIVPEWDCDDLLIERVDRANALHKKEGRTIFVSVHANASAVKNEKTDWGEGVGIETLYYPRSLTSRILADIFQQELVKFAGLRDRGSKGRDNLHVLKATAMPAILTENGFFNHKEECVKLCSNDFRDRIAQGHISAIQRIEKS